MPDEITFFDLAALLKIKPDTTMERYGGMLNSSYFDGANTAGSLSQKKLISFNTALPGQSVITITDTGKALLAEADEKAKAEFDHLDLAILLQMAGNKTTPPDIEKALNIRSRDMAMHLYKLLQGDYIASEFRSGTINLMLTERGFAQSKAGMPVKQAQAQAPQAQMQEQIQTQMQAQMPDPPQQGTGMAPPGQQQQQANETAAQPGASSQPTGKPEGKGRLIIFIAVAVIAILAILAYALMQGIIHV